MKLFKLTALILAAALLFGCASAPKKIGIDDPFSDQLEFYYRRQQSGKTWFLASALAFGVFFAAGTYFATERALNGYTSFNTFGLYSAYAVGLGASGFGAYSFYRWSKNNNLYLQTLRLQTQYYNVINPYE